MNQAKRRKTTGGRPNKIIVSILSLLIVASIAIGTVTIAKLVENMQQNDGNVSLNTNTSSSAPSKKDKVYTATLAATGDLLIHEMVFKSAKQSDGSYNFDSMFSLFNKYVSEVDYAVANLETTLAGTELGYNYSGYPCFNSPDAIAKSAKDAGFDMLLTANNHSYDTREKGMLRTVETIDNIGLDRLGTHKDTKEKRYVVKKINNINIGMLCYTYETDGSKDTVALNGIKMSDTAEELVNAFSYNELDTFYNNVQSDISSMKKDGAEAIVLFIHWGDEYKIIENKKQQTIAQKMCDLGVDVIIGGHPHVIQPVDLLTSTTDQNHKTVCLYSMGNTLSNMPGSWGGLAKGYAQDGVLFKITFEKVNNGKVTIKNADILPIYNNITGSKDNSKFKIIPLDKSLADWKSAFNISDDEVKMCTNSYDRTMATVKEGLDKVNAHFSPTEDTTNDNTSNQQQTKLLQNDIIA